MTLYMFMIFVKFLTSIGAVVCPSSGCPDVWQCLADLCNVLACVDHGEVPLYKADTDESEGEEELTVLQLKEDRLLAGFVPLLAAPQEPCYTDRHTEIVSGSKLYHYPSAPLNSLTQKNWFSILSHVQSAQTNILV